MEKDCFTSLTIDGQLYEIAKAIDSIDPSGVRGTAYYGQVSRITSGIINIATAGTYQSTGLTATLDSENNGVSLGTTDLFAVKNTSGSAQLLKIYGSADIQSGNNQTLGIKLALNGTPIDNTECNAPTGTGSGNFAKLITNWMIELQPNDEVALFVTDKSTAGNITLLRGRLVASTVGKQGPQGPIGPTGPAGSGGSTDVQIFTSSGTWTKPANAKSVHIQLFGAGAGGGSGRRDSTSGTVRSAGGGGGGGSYISINIPASILSSTENVVIGAGGPGGAAQTIDLSNGNAGVFGGNTSFGIIIAPGGSGGIGGTNVGAAGGLGAIEGSSGGQAANNGGAGTAGSPITAYSSTGYGGAGGGGGGGVAANNAQFNAGAGGRSLALSFAGGTAGSAGGNNGGNGNSNTFATTGIFAVGSGGGGGGGGAAVSGGNGGNGGFPAAGGGGGGATYLGAQSGIGGSGSDGLAIITTYF